MRKRVVVVDDDDISRRGLTELLADRPELEVAGSLVHDEALEWDTEWDTIDIAIVDAADSRRDDDHFPGVGVVDHIRRRRSRDQTMVIVLTGHFFDDAVRRRMREAQADFFYHRSELQESADLYEAILHPEQARSGVPDGDGPRGPVPTGSRVGHPRQRRHSLLTLDWSRSQAHWSAGRSKQVVVTIADLVQRRGTPQPGQCRRHSPRADSTRPVAHPDRALPQLGDSGEGHAEVGNVRWSCLLNVQSLRNAARSPAARTLSSADVACPASLTLCSALSPTGSDRHP